MTGIRIALLAYTGALWTTGTFCLWRIPRCPPPSRRRDGGAGARHVVSVIVPARDEELRISGLLESLARQSQPADEMVVVDDASTDGTAELARRLGAKVVSAAKRPRGWTGKAWACWTGARAARGDLLVFLDADVRLARDGIERLLIAHAERGGLVSVQPYHEVPHPYERLSAFCNIVVMGSLGAFTPLGDRLRAGGSFGPCMVVTRQDYLAFGGHAAVRDRVVEDMALGRVARSGGLPVACLGGRGSVRFRMYPDGMRSLLDGWSKSMAIGAGDAPALPRALMVAWLTGATSAAMLLIGGVAALAGRDAAGAGSVGFGVGAAALYGLYAVQVWWMLRRIGSFGPFPALAFPLPLAFFHAVFARSVWLARVRGSVTWKGRRIDVRRAPDPEARRRTRAQNARVLDQRADAPRRRNRRRDAPGR